MSANEETTILKEQLNKIQQRLLKLSTGLDKFQTDETVFISTNTAHFGDELEKSLSPTEQCCSTTDLSTVHQFKQLKPLFRVPCRAITMQSHNLVRPKTPTPLTSKGARQNPMKQSTASSQKRQHYYTQTHDPVSPFNMKKPPMIYVHPPRPTFILHRPSSTMRSGSPMNRSYL